MPITARAVTNTCGSSVMAAIPYLKGKRVFIQRVRKEIDSTVIAIAARTEPENGAPHKRSLSPIPSPTRRATLSNFRAPARPAVDHVRHQSDHARAPNQAPGDIFGLAHKYMGHDEGEKGLNSSN